MCFSKKTNEQKIEIDGFRLRDLAKQFELIITMAGEHPDASTALVRLQDEVKYCKPRAAKEAEKMERKIGNALGDVKILLSGGKSHEKVMDGIQELEYAIVARKAL